MALTKEMVAELVSEIGSSAQRGNKFIAMKILRENLGFGLREAKECVEENAYDDNGLAKIRRIFEDAAGLKSESTKESKPNEQVFENENFRFVMKRGDATPEQVQKFFEDTMIEILKGQ